VNHNCCVTSNVTLGSLLDQSAFTFTRDTESRDVLNQRIYLFIMEKRKMTNKRKNHTIVRQINL